MNLRRRVVPAVLLGVLVTTLPLAALAQGTGQPYVHIHDVGEPLQVSTTGGGLGLSLTTTFSLLKSDDTLMSSPTPKIKDATISVDNNNTTAKVEEMNDIWSVVFLVDTSQTMRGLQGVSDFKSVRTDLATAVAGVPDNTHLALLTFASNTNSLVPFTQKKETVSTAISRLQVGSSGTSCFNEGLYQAVNMLSGAPGRKAVIAFSASADDCANRPVQDVVSLANKNRVQIYSVGLRGYTSTPQELNSISEPTRGLSAMGDVTSVGFAFGNMIGILKNQWTATWTIYPSAGEKTGMVTVNLEDGTELKSKSFTFTSGQDYIPPAEIHLKGKVQSTADGILFNLDIVQPERIRQLNVTIISKDSGQPVLSQSLTSFSDVNTLPAVSLSSGLDYTLNVSAVDSNGQVLSTDSADFKFEPPPASVKVNDVTPPTSGQNAFKVTIASTNLAGAVKYKAWLIETEKDTKINGTEVTVPLGDPILIPADQVGSGDYGVVVQALDSEDTVLAESKAFPLTYKKPSMFSQFRDWVSSSPFAIAGLTGVCCLALLGVIGLVWIIIPKQRDQSIDVDLVLPEGGRRQASPKPGIQVPPRPPAGAPGRGGAQPAQVPGAAPASGPAARLSLRFPAESTWSTEMRRTPFSLGRRKDNDGPLPVDSSSGVSGHHLTISFERGAYFLLDDSSKFGTTINGKPVTKGEPTQLTDGDLIGLGPIVKVAFNIL